MWRTVATTVVVTLGLATVLEAAYLERPLWVAEKGKPLSIAFANEESRLLQAPASQGTEPQWLIPEPYNPPSTGAEHVKRPEDLQWPSQESSYTEQKVREERPSVVESFQLNRPYDDKLPYYRQPELEHPNKDFYYEQRVETELQSAQLNQWQQQLEHQGPSYASEQTVQENAKPWQTKPLIEFRAPYYGQQSWNLIPKPEDSQLQYQWREEQQSVPDNHLESSYAASKPSDGQPSFQPSQQGPEPILPKPTEQQPSMPLAERERPQHSQQAYNPYPARPEMYKPSLDFPESSYQIPYLYQVVSQQNQPLPEPYPRQNWGQAQANSKPYSVSTKPRQGGSKVKKPVFEYQSPQGSLSSLEYNQNQPAAWDNLPSYQPSMQMNSVVQGQANRQPQPQRNQPPVRPAVPNRSPTTSWKGNYQSEQLAPIKKPAPIGKPAPLLMNNNQPPPTYNRQPEAYFEDDEDEEVKYEMPVMHLDVRCPRDDDPAKPVHIASVTSCDKFQKCFNGIAYEMSCPPGLQFDAKHNRCDYAARVNCSL